MDNLRITIIGFVVVGFFLSVMIANVNMQANIRADIKSLNDDIKALSTVLQESD